MRNDYIQNTREFIMDSLMEPTETDSERLARYAAVKGEKDAAEIGTVRQYFRDHPGWRKTS